MLPHAHAANAAVCNTQLFQLYVDRMLFHEIENMPKTKGYIYNYINHYDSQFSSS